MANIKNVISLYSGALGLDLGLERAGFVLKAAVECNQFAVQTIKDNRGKLQNKGCVIIERAMTVDNIGEVCEEVLQRTRLKKSGRYILAGGPPCQPFSTAGKRASLEDERSCGFKIFFKAVKILAPKYFVIENVKGILSAAKKHRPLAKRGPGHPKLRPEEEYGSAFKDILDALENICKEMGYCVSWGIVNSADYGAPQARERVIIIGSLDGHYVWPEPTHSKEGRSGKKKWATLKQALKGLEDPEPAYKKFNETTKNYLKLIPAGHNWRKLPKNLQEKALGAAFKSWGGRAGFLRRLSWTKPAPTITNSPKTKATMLCHPKKTRPLTVRECARIQQFPDNWIFSGSTASQYRQIGNATPLAIGEATGNAIKKSERNGKNKSYQKNLYCADHMLLKRITKRPKTMLNPPRMRKIKDPQKASEWLNSSTNKRTDFEKYKAMTLQTG